MSESPAFVCPHCSLTSYNPNDIRERYCGRCHRVVDDLAGSPAIQRLVDELKQLGHVCAPHGYNRVYNRHNR